MKKPSIPPPPPAAKSDWRGLVEQNQAATFVLPPGWTTRDELAGQLDCSIDRVRVLMAPVIKAKAAETKAFPVWDPVTKRVMRVTAYRQLAAR